MKKGRGGLRVGVVGLGMRSDIAAHLHRPGEGTRVVACCDVRPQLLSTATTRFGPEVRTTTDYRELLALDLDAVFIATPDHTHEQIAVDALGTGVAVFVEKPLAITVEACDRILQAARSHRAPLYVGHNLRHLPAITAMRRLVQQGSIGEVKTIWCRHFVGHGGDYYFRDWHAERRHTLSLLLQKGAHDLDVIQWLAGARPKRVHAMGALTVYGSVSDRRQPGGQLMRDWLDLERNWPPTKLHGLNPVIDVEDVSLVNLLLDNGVLASYQQCHFSPDYWRNYTVIGSEGRLENFGDVDAVIKVWTRRSGFREDADQTVRVDSRAGTHGGADPLVVEEFLRFARHGGATVTSPVAARDAVAAGVAATASLRTGGSPVVVPSLPDDLIAYYAEGQPGAGRRAPPP